MIEAGLLGQAQEANCFKQPKGASSIRVGCIFRRLERDLNVALCGEIVDFVRLCFLNDPDEIRQIGHVPEMQEKARVLNMGILVEMLNTIGVERR